MAEGGAARSCRCRSRVPCGVPCTEDTVCEHNWCNPDTGLSDCWDSINCGCETPCSWPRFCNDGCSARGYCSDSLQGDAVLGECISMHEGLSAGMPCTQSCANLCDPQTNQCASCLALGKECAGDDDCCSGICDDGHCFGCLEDGRPCEESVECCSGACGSDGLCVACAM
jgi:hypothetical protein